MLPLSQPTSVKVKNICYNKCPKESGGPIDRDIYSGHFWGGGDFFENREEFEGGLEKEKKREEKKKKRKE